MMATLIQNVAVDFMMMVDVVVAVDFVMMEDEVVAVDFMMMVDVVAAVDFMMMVDVVVAVDFMMMEDGVVVMTKDEEKIVGIVTMPKDGAMTVGIGIIEEAIQEIEIIGAVNVTNVYNDLFNTCSLGNAATTSFCCAFTHSHLLI